jgi:endonuclease/exonuclease/phosphatase (EEP) superfamily protein YafD
LNTNGIEITVLRFIMFTQITIIAIYRPPRISVTQLCHTLRGILSSLPTSHNIFIGDFNLNWLNKQERRPLYNLFVQQFGYKQLVSCYTTDNKTCIDHIYSNLSDSNVKANVLETYFSDHKAVYVLVNTF